MDRTSKMGINKDFTEQGLRSKVLVIMPLPFVIKLGTLSINPLYKSIRILRYIYVLVINKEGFFRTPNTVIHTLRDKLTKMLRTKVLPDSELVTLSGVLEERA